MKLCMNVIVEPTNSLKKVSDEKDKNQKILRQNEAKMSQNVTPIFVIECSEASLKVIF